MLGHRPEQTQIPVLSAAIQYLAPLHLPEAAQGAAGLLHQALDLMAATVGQEGVAAHGVLLQEELETHLALHHHKATMVGHLFQDRQVEQGVAVVVAAQVLRAPPETHLGTEGMARLLQFQDRLIPMQVVVVQVHLTEQRDRAVRAAAGMVAVRMLPEVPLLSIPGVAAAAEVLTLLEPMV